MYVNTMKIMIGKKTIYQNNLSKVDPFDFFECNRAGWYDYNSEYGNCEVKSVVAWMELPKPYVEK